MFDVRVFVFVLSKLSWIPLKLTKSTLFSLTYFILTFYRIIKTIELNVFYSLYLYSALYRYKRLHIISCLSHSECLLIIRIN